MAGKELCKMRRHVHERVSSFMPLSLSGAVFQARKCPVCAIVRPIAESVALDSQYLERKNRSRFQWCSEKNGLEIMLPGRLEELSIMRSFEGIKVRAAVRMLMLHDYMYLHALWTPEYGPRVSYPP